MIYKVGRLTPQGRERIRNALKRSWRDGTHRERQRSREIDVDSLRKRALEDRRGTHYATITKQTNLGAIYFTLLWSVAGRVDQVDIIESGSIVATVRPSLALSTIDKFTST